MDANAWILAINSFVNLLTGMRSLLGSQMSIVRKILGHVRYSV